MLVETHVKTTLQVTLQALKQQCTAEVEAVRSELQHKQRQAARLLKARSEDEAIKVNLSLCKCCCHCMHAIYAELH